MSSLDVIVAQTPAELEGKEARFNWLSESLECESLHNADLLLLPELFLTGYYIGDNVKHWAETENGLYATKIAELCKQYDIAIHYGFSEKSENQFYNSAQCISRNGKSLAKHRKLLLPPGFEGDHFTGGNSFEIFSINDFSIATLICYDAEFPENFRHVAQLGVDLVMVPTALSSQWGVVAHQVIPTRAFENGVFVCYANQAGTENGLDYLGGSCIIGPDGTEIRRAGSNAEFLRATLSQSEVTAAQQRLPYLQDMRRLSDYLINH